MWSKWFPQCKQPLNIYSGFPSYGPAGSYWCKRRTRSPTSAMCFVLPPCSLAFTAVRLPVVYYPRLGRAGWMLFCPAAAVKGKVKSGCKLPSGQSSHCLMWQCILSLQDGNVATDSSLTYNATRVCVCLVLFCSAFLFLWHIASVIVAMWGTNMKQCLTHTAHGDISWRKWGFYWQRCEVHIISIELQASVSSSLTKWIYGTGGCWLYVVIIRSSCGSARGLYLFEEISTVCVLTEPSQHLLSNSVVYIRHGPSLSKRMWGS